MTPDELTQERQRAQWRRAAAKRRAKLRSGRPQSDDPMVRAGWKKRGGVWVPR